MADRGGRGGKHNGSLLGRGDFGLDTAGQRHHLTKKEWGTKRQFVGSGDKDYVFYSETLGTLTISANSYWEALRIARSRGYSRKQYKKNRRR